MKKINQTKKQVVENKERKTRREKRVKTTRIAQRTARSPVRPSAALTAKRKKSPKRRRICSPLTSREYPTTRLVRRG